MRKLRTALAILGVLVYSVAGAALAANAHSSSNPTGQPSQSCHNPSRSTTPGNASNPNNTGAPFSPNGTSSGV